jgi:putative FmdB family regulatory protein
MPTYRYECGRCGAVHEIFHPMSDHSARKCPDCDGKLERHVGGAGGVILKGSGFHNTDYRSDSYRKAAKKDTTPKKSESSSKGSKDKKKTEPKKKKPDS